MSPPKLSKAVEQLVCLWDVFARSVFHKGHDTSGILSPTKSSGFICASVSLLDTGNDAAGGFFLSTVCSAVYGL